jgi:hypothetical protein
MCVGPLLIPLSVVSQFWILRPIDPSLFGLVLGKAVPLGGHPQKSFALHLIWGVFRKSPAFFGALFIVFRSGHVLPYLVVIVQKEDIQMSPRTERIVFLLSEHDLRRVDEFRFANHIPSRAAAIRELMRRGLQIPDPKPEWLRQELCR